MVTPDYLSSEVSTFSTTLEDIDFFVATWKPWYPCILAVCAVLITVGVFGNGFSLLTFFKHVSRRTVTDCLICSLNSADLLSLMSFALLTFFTFTESGIQIVSRKKTVCLTVLSANIFSILSSLIIILSLNIQRLMAVLTPIRFKNQQKKCTLLAFVLLPWFLLTVVITLPLFGWNEWASGKRCDKFIYNTQYQRYFITGPVVVVLLAIPLINAATFVALACRQQSKVASNTQGTTSKKSLTQMMTKKHLEVSKTMLMLVGSLYACILPNMATTILIGSGLKIYPDLEIFNAAVKVLMPLNAALNPLIYARKNQHLREALTKVRHFFKN